jgi:hypothetical protein
VIHPKKIHVGEPDTAGLFPITIIMPGGERLPGLAHVASALELDNLVTAVVHETFDGRRPVIEYESAEVRTRLARA